MKRTKINDLLESTDFGSTVCVKGWVRTRRSGKAVSFIALNDGSTIKNVQIVADAAVFDSELLKQITTGSCLSVIGKMVESPGAGQSWKCRLNKLKSWAPALKTIPCRKKDKVLST